jgi:hypothetical protein
MSHLEVLRVQMLLVDALRSDAAQFWFWQRPARQSTQLASFEHIINHLRIKLDLPKGSLPNLDALKVKRNSIFASCL